MSKHGIIGRVAQLAHANVSAVIDAADNPQGTAEDLARNFSTTIAEAEQAIATLTENRRITTDDQREDAEAAEMWAAAAAATSQTADEFRAAGDAAAADRFDNLARIALARELMAENDVEASQHAISAQTESVETLRVGLGRMHANLSELQETSHRLTAESGGAQNRRHDRAVRNIDVLDPASEVALFQDLVSQEESRPVDGASAGIIYTGNGSAAENEIEERLQGLKTARAMASALARASDQPFR
jgi:phage shock protein A